MKDLFSVKPFTNKRNAQISLAVLKRKTSNKFLDLMRDKNVKSIEINIKRIILKDEKLSDKKGDIKL